MQNAIGTALMTAWLGGLPTPGNEPALGRLLTLEECGVIFNGTSPIDMHRGAAHANIGPLQCL